MNTLITNENLHDVINGTENEIKSMMQEGLNSSTEQRLAETCAALLEINKYLINVMGSATYSKQ